MDESSDQDELDPDVKPPVHSNSTDVQLQMVCKEGVPSEQQGWSSGLDQRNPLELPRIKEEPEEIWTSQEGELHRQRMKTDGEDCGAPEPAKNSGQGSQENNSHCSEPETVDSKEEVPLKQQDRSPSLDQYDPLLRPHVKEEDEELLTSQEREQLRGLEVANVAKFTFTPVLVKSEEDDEEKPQVSQLHQTKGIRMDAEDCGGPEPARNSDQGSPGKTSHSSEPESDDSWDWQDNRKPRPVSHSLENNDTPVTGGKPFRCLVCGKSYPRKNSLKDHMRLHSEGKRFSCSVCRKTFQWRAGVVRHMRVHTGEKPYSCYFCNQSFAQNSSLSSHLRVHTGEKPFKCSVCKARFRVSCHLSKHMRLHSGEKPFSCSVCGKAFAQRGTLRRHATVHTGEKPFGCPACGKSFSRPENLKRHASVHGEEKPSRPQPS